MKDKAIARITDEMMKINTPHAQAVEEYLTGICTTDAVAEKLLDESKSLKGFLDELLKEARKRSKGNVAYIAPEEVWEMVEKYYGITEEDKSSMVAVTAEDIIDISDFL